MIVDGPDITKGGCIVTAVKPPYLYSRLRQHGTLAEKPEGVPDARSALPSTIHWMRALAILAVDQKVDFAAARACYSSVQAAEGCFWYG